MLIGSPHLINSMQCGHFHFCLSFFLGGEGMFVDSYKCKALLKDGSLNSKVKRERIIIYESHFEMFL